MLRQLQDPNKDFQEPFVPAVSGVEAGGTLRHWDTTCTRTTRAGRINKAWKNGRRLWDLTSCPLTGLLMAKGKTQAHLPWRQQLGSPCAGRNTGSSPCDTGMRTGFGNIRASARGKENGNRGVQRAQSLIICFSIAWRAAEREEGEELLPPHPQAAL